MTPFVAFLIGVFASGIVLALVFGALHLEAEQKAYWQGYLQCAEDDKIVRRERSSNETDI